MADQKKRISELPESQSTQGLYTIGVNSQNESVKVPLGTILARYDQATQDAAQAKTMAQSAQQVAASASSKADNASSKADLAKTTADNAASTAEEAKRMAQEANEILLFGGILTDSISARDESFGGEVQVKNIYYSTAVDCIVYKYLPLPATPETQPVYYMNFDGRDKYSDNDFLPYTGKLYQNINTENYYYHLDSFKGLKIFEPKVSDIEKSVLWFNGVGTYIVQQTGISETGSWENVVYDLDSDKFVYRKVTSSNGVETVTYYDTWSNEGLYNDSTTRMPRKGLIFFNAANCRFYSLSAQSTFDELNSGPTIEQYNDLVQTVAGKEQKMTVKSVSAPEKSSVQLEANVYHEFRDAVGIVDVYLPTTGIENGVTTCVLYLTTDSAPAISFYFTSVEDAHISYQEGFAIEANSEYEINCLWNGGWWFIAAMKIAASASTNSNNE